jgi:hypothetical protein
MSDVVQGYADLASSMVDRWSALASRAASELDAGTYDAGSWAEDVTEGATLAAEASLCWTAETIDAFAAFAGGEVRPNIVTSPKFRAPAGARLELEGMLQKGPELPTLPAEAVRIEPPQLGPTETEFTLRADATGHRGGTYVGRVKATKGEETTRVIVWIAVP